MSLQMPFTFSNLPQGWTPVQYLDADFQYLLGLIATGGSANVQVVTSGASFAVPVGTMVVALSKLMAGPTTLALPPVGLADGIPLWVFDWAGNAGPITIQPAAGELVMGLSSATIVSNGQGAGFAGSATLIPSTTLGGWLVRSSDPSNVTGPSAAVDGNFAAMSGTSGKIIADSGKSAASFATAAQGAKADDAVTYTALAALPTSLPSQPGVLWNNGGVLSIS